MMVPGKCSTEVGGTTSEHDLGPLVYWLPAFGVEAPPPPPPNFQPPYPSAFVRGALQSWDAEVAPKRNKGLD